MMLDIEYYHNKDTNDFYRAVNHIIYIHDIYGRKALESGMIRAKKEKYFEYITKMLRQHLKRHFKSKYNYDFNVFVKELTLTGEYERGTIAWGRILLDGETSDLVHLKMKYL